MTNNQNQQKEQSPQKRLLNPLDFTLLYDNILVEAVDQEEVDGEYGIIRSKGYEDKPEIGKVLSIGKGRLFDNGTVVPLDVKVGDVVYFNKYSSVKVRLDTRDFYILKEEDVQAYLRDGSDA